MNTRLALIFASCLSLSGCSLLNGLSMFEDETPPPPSAATAAPAAAPAIDDELCQRAAVTERQRAQQNGFDAATLDRMTLAAYQQCRALGAQ